MLIMSITTVQSGFFKIPNLNMSSMPDPSKFAIHEAARDGRSIHYLLTFSQAD